MMYVDICKARLWRFKADDRAVEVELNKQALE